MKNKITCEYCKKKYSKFGIDNHIKIVHLKTRKSANHSRKNKIPWNKGLDKDDERVRKISEKVSKSMKGMRGHSVSKETKERLSEARSKYLEENGSGGFKNVKWYKYKNILNQEFILRGKWELNVAKWLNNKNYIWIRKEYLKYVDNNGIKRTYTPDFYLPVFDRYIEVKGYFSKIDKEKIKLVKEQNNIKLIMLFAKHIKKIAAQSEAGGSPVVL